MPCDVTTVSTCLVASSRTTSTRAASAPSFASASSTTSNVGRVACRARRIASTTASEDSPPAAYSTTAPSAMDLTGQLGRQPRLADAGLTDQHDQSTDAALRPFPALAQPTPVSWSS